MSHVTGNETDAEKIPRLEGLVAKLEKELTASEVNCNRIIAAASKGENPNQVQLEIKISNLEAELINAQRVIKGMSKECHEVEQYLGQAMAYPWYKDDQKNFPGASDADGVCTGEHTPGTIAMEAGTLIIKLQGDLKYERDNSIPHSVLDQMREELEIAKSRQIGIFDVDYPPIASQGEPTHEVVDYLTADTVNFWIQRIEQLTQGNAELEAQNQALQIAINCQETGASASLETHNNILQGVRSDNMWRTRRIGVVENCLRWALRALINTQTNPHNQRDIMRANEMFARLFPPNENPERIRFSHGMAAAPPTDPYSTGGGGGTTTALRGSNNTWRINGRVR